MRPDPPAEPSPAGPDGHPGNAPPRAAGAALVRVDARQRIVEVNADAERIFGHAAAAMIGQPLAMLIPERFHAAHARHIEQFAVSDTGVRRMGVVRVAIGLRGNGQEFPVDAELSMHDSPGGRIFTAILRDLTEPARILDALREGERRFGELLENVALASVMLDQHGIITYCNPHLLQLTGWERGDLVGRDWFAAVAPADGDALRSAFTGTLAAADVPRHHEGEILTRSGEQRLVRWSHSVLRSASGAVLGMASIGEDITEQRRAEIAIRHLNRVYAMLSGISTLIVRAHTRDELFREACRVAVQAGGFHMALICTVEPGTDRFAQVATAGQEEQLLASIGKLLASGESALETLVAQAIRERRALVANDALRDPRVRLGRDYARTGIRSLAILPLLVSGEPLGAIALFATERDFFRDGEMKLLAGLAEDIAFGIDHIGKTERIEYLARFDPLTGLANESLFLERVGRCLAASRNESACIAVLVLDVERFKSINDAFGRLAGDEILRRIASRFTRQETGELYRFARIGPDRFAILYTNRENAEPVAGIVEREALAYFEEPFQVRDEELRISVRVGVALAAVSGTQAEVLLRNAEAALKKAKATGYRHLLFDHSMTERIAEHLSMESRLRRAIDREEFVLHYQPKVSVASGKLIGAEALLRWNDVRDGLVSPMRFIPILEESGMIHEVGRWAMRKAIDDHRRWRASGLPAVRLAVNVSPLQLRGRDFACEVAQAIAGDADSAQALELEITENVIMENIEHNITVLKAIRESGVTIAIDDFGTGFSSLSYLSRLPVDTLKIDRSFVIAIDSGPDGLSLVSTIITLAHALALNVVAEGVETAEQLRILRLIGCDSMQGYLFSRPVPADVFEAKFLAAGPSAG